MHLLYVPEFQVQPTDPEGGVKPLLRLLAHVARRLGRGLDGASQDVAQDVQSKAPVTIGDIDGTATYRVGISHESSQRARRFEFDRRSYDRTPHVKVRDAVKPNQVGRIHFTMDSDDKRFVIDHVALELYGI